MKRSDYIALFSGAREASERQIRALDRAHDIRKFEIEMYWKRATYFWTIIAAALAGYFLLSSQPLSVNRYLLASVGLLFSIAWYLVNRASSRWQRNWEAHVDLLEDEVTGPLHKTIIGKSAHRFWDMAGPYGFSPSRVHTILSLIVIGLWTYILATTGWALFATAPVETGIVSICAAAAVASIFLWGRPNVNPTRPEPDVQTRRYP